MTKLHLDQPNNSGTKKNRWTVAFASFVLISAASGFLLDSHHEQISMQKAISTGDIDLYQFEYFS